MFGCHLLEARSFLRRGREGVDLEKMGGGKKLGGVEERETIIRIYCTRVESIFNKREEKSK